MLISQITTPPPAAGWVMIGLAGIVLLAAVKLFWGMAQWTRKTQHRVGERWGDEAVEVIEWSGREGMVRAGGELWRAHSAELLSPGDRVRVAKTKGLLLEVKTIPAPKESGDN